LIRVYYDFRYFRWFWIFCLQESNNILKIPCPGNFCSGLRQIYIGMTNANDRVK
jgi:hypothetical protein